MVGSRTLLFVAAITLGAPVPVYAQATKYDGTYNGVSLTASGGGRSCIPPRPVPLPLTIRAGTAQWQGGMTGDIAFQGTVSADGAITAKGSNGATWNGRIDASGKISGGTNGGGSCTIMAVWQK